MLETILTVINLAGAFYLLQNGQFFKTKYFKIASLFIASYFIGIFFKITHWSFGNELITISSVAILLLYFKYFTTKVVKNKLEYLKIAWVVSTFGVGLIRILHLTLLDLHIIPPVIMSFIILEHFRREKTS